MIPGYHARTSPSGIRVIELDYIADPAKRDPAWAAAARKVFPSERKWQREMERNWAVAAGDPWYPEWHIAGGHKAFVHPSPGLIPGPVYRGWDFGIRYSAVTWSQFSPTQRRWWVLREFMPDGLSVYTFRDLALYLSGQLPEDSLNLQGKAWAARLRNDSHYPNPPWFRNDSGQPTQFVDFSGHEAYQARAEVAQETEERSSLEILAAAGVYLQPHYGAVKSANLIIRDLMRLRDDGWPGLLVDPACPILIEGLEGRIVFASPTASNPLPDKPLKDGYYEHVHEALLYSMPSVVPLGDAPPPPAPRVVVYSDRRPVVEDRAATLDFYELRGEGR